MDIIQGSLVNTSQIASATSASRSQILATFQEEERDKDGFRWNKAKKKFGSEIGKIKDAFISPLFRWQNQLFLPDWLPSRFPLCPKFRFNSVLTDFIEKVTWFLIGGRRSEIWKSKEGRNKMKFLPFTTDPFHIGPPPVKASTQLADIDFRV